MSNGDGLFQARVPTTRELVAAFSEFIGRIQGIDADGDPVTVDPVVVGGVDGAGNVQQLLVDTAGNTQVVGTAADDAPVSGNPVYLGARYLADIFASALSASGDMGSLVVDMYRRLYVRSAAYDTVAAADRTVPVFLEVDRGDEFDITTTTAAAGNGTYNFYMDLEGYRYWTLLYDLGAVGGAGTVTGYIFYSDDVVNPDITTRTYRDVTNDLFGVATFTADVNFIADTPQRVGSMKIAIVVAGLVGAETAAWTAYGYKGA